MIHTHRSLSVLANLLLCLALALSFAPVGLAGQAENDGDMEVYLPLMMKPVLFQESIGILDSSFDGNGWVQTQMGVNNEWANDVAIQRDGKIVVAGGAALVDDMDFALARYNPDGSLDTSFDGDGKVFTELSGTVDECVALALQSDSKIVAAGYTIEATTNFALVRYNPDGSLDITFSDDGIQTTDFDYTEDAGMAIALQTDGKIVVAGITQGVTEDFAVARYNPDGSLDTTFSGDGKVTTDFASNTDNSYGVLVQPDGKIVVVGVGRGTTRDFALARYNSDGSLDDTFDGDGKLLTDFTGSSDYGYALALQSDGKIVAVGHTSANTGDFAVVRYNSNGSLDTTFDGDGMLVTDFTDDYESAYDVTLQPNGKVVVVGYGLNGLTFDIILARYNPNGSLDASFSGDGKLLTEFTGSHENGLAVALQADGKIVVAGSININYSDYAFLVLRYK